MSQTKKYTLTEEHRARLPEWRDMWIKNAMSTERMSDEDKRITTEAIYKIYDAAGLRRPKAIVFVSSPFVMRFAAGAAAWIWYCRKRAATDEATREATDAATDDATYAATDDATRDATDAATDEATRAATYAATYAATDAATYAATRAATRDATDDLSKWYVSTALTSQISRDGLECAKLAWRMWQGGNQWSSYDSFLSFFDRVAGLDLPEYKNWRYWEQASLHSGPRIMHEDFCIVSDRPELLLVDDRDRPHCETGPFCRWRDGSALYAVRGVRVPAWIIERKQDITVKSIEDESNAEVRRVMIDQYGADRYMQDSGAEEIARDKWGILYRKDIPGDEPIVVVRYWNSTREPDGSTKEYWHRVNPELRPLRKNNELGEPQEFTAHNAVASTFGMRGSEYCPDVET